MQELKQRAQTLVPPITEGLQVEDIEIKSFDQANITLRTYKPTVSPDQSQPTDCVF